MNYLEIAFPRPTETCGAAARPVADSLDAPAALTSFERLEREGYLVVRSSVVGGLVLFVLDASRVPTDLWNLPAFGWDEIGHLLKLPREAARQAIRDLLTAKATLGSRSRLTAASEAPAGPGEAPEPAPSMAPPPAASRPAGPADAPRETGDLFGPRGDRS